MQQRNKVKRMNKRIQDMNEEDCLFNANLMRVRSVVYGIVNE